MSSSEESDFEYASDEDGLGEPRGHKQKLADALQWIKTINTRKNAAAESEKRKIKLTEADVDDFFETFPDLTDDKNLDTPTILHAVVNLVVPGMEANINSGTVNPLVQKLVQRCTRFLCIAHEDENPLSLAITKKKRHLVDCMVMSCPDEEPGRQYLARALEHCRDNNERKNCLHLAFDKNLKTPTLERMVRDASIKALEAVDTAGRRPIHYAVLYKHCNVEVVRAFIDRDQELVDRREEHSSPEPLDTFLDVNGQTKISVYQEHLLSALAHDQERASKQGISSHKMKGDSSIRDDDKGKHARPQMDEAAKGHNLAIKARPEPRLDPKSAIRPARPEPDHPAVSRDPRDVQERIGRPKDRVRDKKVDNDDSLDALEQRREILKQLEARARREELERNSNPREASRDRRSMGPAGSRDALRVQTAIGPPSATKPSGDVAANTPKLLRRVPTMLGEIADGNGRSESRSKRTTTVTKKSRKPVLVDHEALARDSKTVLRNLKLHYMRTRNAEKATSWLYQTNPQDVQTFYVHPRLPSELRKKRFKDAFKDTRFDDVLQFVHFPNVKVTESTPKSKDDRIARRDMEFFFDFLHNEKKVGYILKVTVEEGGQSVHSDEAIKKALDQIAVEHLDWRKIDLDPQIICGIGSQARHFFDKNDAEGIPKNQLRKLDLQWSGNTAVLRAWSEPEGLPSLPHLNEVKIIVPDGVLLYDSTEWIDEKTREFEKRLNKHSIAVNPRQETDESAPAALSQRKIKVKFSGLKSHTAPGRKAATGLLQAGLAQGRAGGVMPERIINTHEWLRCTDSFAKNISPLWKSTRDEYLKSTGKFTQTSDPHTSHRPGKLSCPEDEVVVALIDDGVSLLDHREFVGHVLEGKTFDYRGNSIGQSYNSARGHGTEMALNILRICPMAKIYPIRLKIHNSEDGTRSEIDLKSAAEAINAALEKNATIISMSWTIPIPEENDPGRKLLVDAVHKACKQNVLLFCSSSDGGGFENVEDYPSAAKRDQMFRIGAAHDHGSAFEHTDKGVDYICPGVQVNTNATSPATGSSIATALAAGLAATIIYCFKISVLASKTRTQTSRLQVNEGRLNDVSRYKGMRAAFDRLGKVNTPKFIQIWEVLIPVVDKLENLQDDGNPNIKVEAIMDLCAKLA